MTDLDEQLRESQRDLVQGHLRIVGASALEKESVQLSKRLRVSKLEIRDNYKRERLERRNNLLDAAQAQVEHSELLQKNTEVTS